MYTVKDLRKAPSFRLLRKRKVFRLAHFFTVSLSKNTLNRLGLPSEEPQEAAGHPKKRWNVLTAMMRRISDAGAWARDGLVGG